MERLYRIGEKPLVMAHRGGGHEHPENSRVAFEAMRTEGFLYVETDAHATSDGVAVISHDPMVDRMTDGSGLIASMTWQEISQLRDKSGHRMMRVDEVLDEFPDLIFNIDAKNDAVAGPLVAAIRRTDAQSRVCVASFNEKRLRRIRRQLPGITTSIGVSAVARLVIAAHMGGLSGRVFRGIPGPHVGAEVVQVPIANRGIPVLGERFVSVAHQRGLAVHAWTINDLDEVDQLLAWGVDGIITDEPSAVRDHIG